MEFNSDVFAVLNWLEDNIDDEHLENVKNRHVKALRFEVLDKPVAQIHLPVEGLDPYRYIDTYSDMEKMLYNELLACVTSVISKDDAILGIRSNFGVGTMPALFGAKDRITDEDTKPWVDHMSTDEIQAVLQKGMPDMEAGYGKQIYDIYCYYQEMLSIYPKCKKHIHLFHPDMQGSFDITHLIMGTDIYYKLYDNPDIVEALLSLVTDTYIAFLKHLNPLLTDKFSLDGKNYCYHFRHIWGGNVLLRNDTAVNLSDEQYLEFVKPYDERILKEVGGGSIHFCGRADQWIQEMFQTKNIGGINYGYMANKYVFGQPLLDFVKPYMHNNHVPVVCYTLADKDFDSFDFHKYNTGVTFSFNAVDMDDLKRKQEALAQ